VISFGAAEAISDMHPAVTAPATMLRLNTELFLNCLAGVGEVEAARRVTPDTDSMAFVAAHLVDGRHFLTEYLGAPLPNPLAQLLQGAKRQDDLAALPAVTELLAMWEAVSAHLAVTVERLDTGQLSMERRPFPGSDRTILGGIAFLTQHESFHIGQLALIRRQLGLPEMSYELRPREPGRRGA
jgi:uncharacterized damage-inducible protein DinB